jgi:hypothetical protein
MWTAVLLVLAALALAESVLYRVLNDQKEPSRG